MTKKNSPIIQRETFVAVPKPGVSVRAFSFYTHAMRDELTSVHWLASRSDTADVSYIRRSIDNGKTWSDPVTNNTQIYHGQGMHYLSPGTPVLDPNTNRLVAIQSEGRFDDHSVHQGLTRYRLTYKVYQDGQFIIEPMTPVVHEGQAFDLGHPVPGVHIGTNSFMVGDLGGRPIMRSDGVVMVPFQITPIDDHRQRIDPYGVKKYRHSAVLFGRWRDDATLAWTMSKPVSLDFSKSTRGVLEPTLAQLPDGRILMVMRGSNMKSEDMPGHKWYSLSDDGGETWSTPNAWSYTNGESFFSPSSCSQLIPLEDGRLFWLGNICPTNPKGNHPRYPLVLAEVDARSGQLIKESCIAIDDCGPDDSSMLQLSSTFARQERHTGDLLIHTTRAFAQSQPDPAGIRNASGELIPENKSAATERHTPNWTADADLVRLSLK